MLSLLHAARLYNMHVKLHELRQGSSLETYINDLNTLTCHVELPVQQKIFGPLLIR